MTRNQYLKRRDLYASEVYYHDRQEFTTGTFIYEGIHNTVYYFPRRINQKNHTDFLTNSSSSGGFLEIMREFIPLDEIGEEKAKQLFYLDAMNGKFYCNVYMDRTD